MNRTILFFCMMISAWSAQDAQAKVFITVKEALETAFPENESWTNTTETRYLTQSQIQKAKELSGVEAPSALVVRYHAKNKKTGKEEFAYTDTHRIRSHMESLLVIVDSENRIRHLEVLAFDEPLEYMPRDQWYRKFDQAGLDADLEVKRRIPFVTGASLTAQASTQAARRVLSIHAALQEKTAKK
jgi:electron transport complex protein RnfG